MQEQNSRKTSIFAATAENFAELVLENSRRGLVLVDFWSPRAGPSLRQREVLSALARSMGGRFLLATVNTDEQKKLAEDYGVRSLPSCKLFRNAKVVEELRGMQPEADYRRIVERHLAGPGGRVQQAALQAWQSGQAERALKILAEAAVEQPDDPNLPLLMAKLLVRQGRQADAWEIPTAVPPPAAYDKYRAQLRAHLDFSVTAAAGGDAGEPARTVASAPDDWEARYRLASVRLVGDDYEGAMEQLMAIQRGRPGFRDGIARKGLLALFNMLDAGDQRVKRYRSELFKLTH